MTRLIFAIPALVTYCGTLVAAAPAPTPPAAIIGAEKPVFLGRMVVTATPL
jgi:hypothetical protein